MVVVSGMVVKALGRGDYKGSYSECCVIRGHFTVISAGVIDMMSLLVIVSTVLVGRVSAVGDDSCCLGNHNVGDCE